MFYTRLSNREMEDWLETSDRLCRSLGLRHIPDHSNLCRAFYWLHLATVRALERQLLNQLQLTE